MHVVRQAEHAMRVRTELERDRGHNDQVMMILKVLKFLEKAKRYPSVK